MRTKVIYDGKTLAFTEGKVIDIRCKDHKMVDDLRILIDTEEGIKPSGVIKITKNDIYDVTQYASADVDVPIPEPSYEIYNGTVTIDDGTVHFITFTLGGIYPHNEVTTYRAEEGMTWAEWVESEYNTDAKTLIKGGRVYYKVDGFDYSVQDTESYAGILATDAIINGYAYKAHPITEV